MKAWVDAQLPPSLARSLSKRFEVEAVHVLDLGLEHAKDEAIFFRAREFGAIVITKDVDFVRLLERHGAPPQVMWITLGNLRNAELISTVELHWPRIRAHLEAGEPLVELSDAT